MNYNNIKKIVIETEWTTPKTGHEDEYRSLISHIDIFINHIKKADSPLSWLPLEILTDEEIAELICAYLKRSKANRLILHNLDYNGLKYNYEDFIVRDLKKECSWKITLDAVPRLKNLKPLKILDIIPKIENILGNAHNTGYKKSVAEISAWNDGIISNILEEKRLYKCMGIGYANLNYIDKYIFCVDTIVILSLIHLIINNTNISDKMFALLRIEEKTNTIYDHKFIKKKVNLSKKDLQETRMLRREEYHLNPNDIADISIYYTQFLQRKAFFAEEENIINLLQKEIKEEGNLFTPIHLPTQSEVKNYKEDEIKDFILEGIRVPYYDVKYKETLKILTDILEQQYDLKALEDIINIKIIFREIFMSKQKYLRKTASTIARNMLANVKEEDYRLFMFLDIKFIRGYFREMNLIDEYEIFNRICINVKKLLIKSYSALNDEEAVRIIFYICYNFLYIFYNDKYSGIEIE